MLFTNAIQTVQKFNIWCSYYEFITDPRLALFFLVQYLAMIYRKIKEWRKNRQWSFSCCLAIALPLNELQGELSGLVGTNVLKQQLQTGKVDMPSITNTLQDTGVAEISLEETAEAKVTSAKAFDKEDDTNSGVNKRPKLKPCTVYSVSDVSIADIIIHKLPQETSV